MSLKALEEVGFKLLCVDTLLRQFLFEVAHLASNLQTLSCSIDICREAEVDCGAVADSFPQLARLHALELKEGPDASRRCFLAVYLAL